MNSSHLSLGIVQENPIVGDIKGNLNLAERAIKDILSKEKVDVILFHIYMRQNMRKQKTSMNTTYPAFPKSKKLLWKIIILKE